MQCYFSSGVMCVCVHVCVCVCQSGVTGLKGVADFFQTQIMTSHNWKHTNQQKKTQKQSKNNMQQQPPFFGLSFLHQNKVCSSKTTNSLNECLLWFYVSLLLCFVCFFWCQPHTQVMPTFLPVEKFFFYFWKYFFLHLVKVFFQPAKM